MTEQVAADFLPDALPEDPMPMLAQWLAEARERATQPNSNAMTLATCRDGQPSARIVLCKGFDSELGVIDFYTNYHSRKAREIDDNPRVALVFHWDHLSRQARIEGIAQRASAAQSDAYFASRPRLSQIGAWASDQSQPIAGRNAMMAQIQATTERFDAKPDAAIPRPPHWGGYRVWAESCELWVEARGRVHDRARFSRSLNWRDSDSPQPGAWQGRRLQP